MLHHRIPAGVECCAGTLGCLATPGCIDAGTKAGTWPSGSGVVTNRPSGPTAASKLFQNYFHYNKNRNRNNFAEMNRKLQEFVLDGKYPPPPPKT